MPATSEIVVLDGQRHPSQAFAGDVLRGLVRTPKRLPSKYFYDPQGSRLFQEITETDEYYLTRCEREILQSRSGELADALGGGPLRMVELGVGDGHKTALLLDRFLALGRDFRYVPIDICAEVVTELTDALGRRYATGGLALCGLVGDYFDSLAWLHRQAEVPTLVLFLGSSIGNFHRRATQRFLRRLRGVLSAGDHLLIGFDLKKDVPTLHRAYNDARGVTRRFNLNLLARINAELGANFELSRFQHHGYFNARRGCMESWLISTVAQEIHIGHLRRTFPMQAWEGIHVEDSYKFDLDEIEAVASATGFRVRRHWLDSQGYFADSLWQAVAS